MLTRRTSAQDDSGKKNAPPRQKISVDGPGMLDRQARADNFALMTAPVGEVPNLSFRLSQKDGICDVG